MENDVPRMFVLVYRRIHAMKFFLDTVDGYKLHSATWCYMVFQSFSQPLTRLDASIFCANMGCVSTNSGTRTTATFQKFLPSITLLLLLPTPVPILASG